MTMRTRCVTIVVLVPLLASSILAGCGREERLTTSSPEALRAYEEALGLYEQFYYREALEAIDRSIAADSGFAMAWLRRGVLSSELKDEGASRKDLERALFLSRDVTPSEQLAIRMWHAMLAYRLDEAARTADSLIDLYPGMREPYLLRGRLYEQEKKPQEAIAMYQRAITVDSSDARAVMSLGYAYSNLNDVDRASEMMERYIRLRPRDADPPASYGDVLLRTGRFEDALRQYRASLDIKSDYWYSYQRIGDIYAILGRLREAEEQYARSLDLLPRGGQTRVNRIFVAGRMALLRGRYEVAAEEFRGALAIDSTSGEAAYGLTYAFAKQGRLDDADRIIERIHQELKRRNLLASQAMASYHRMRAAALMERGKYEEAMAAAQEALGASIPMNRLPIYNLIAEIRLRTGELELAFEALEEALAIAPNMPDILLTLAKVYQKKGDREMTQKLAQMLWKTWKDADADFYRLAELRRLAPPPRMTVQTPR